MNWPLEEEKVLTYAWADGSGDPKVGNDQDGATFYRKVTRAFLSEMKHGDY